MGNLGVWARRLGDRLERIEQTWFGWTFAPTRRVLAESVWTADSEQAYCGRCGSSVGRGEATAQGCGSCRGSAAIADVVVRLGAYTGPLREWIPAIKYHGWSEMAEVLGRRLGRAVAECGRRQGWLDPGCLVVVPMPMPWQRRLYRGTDHARLIAAAVAAELHAPRVQLLAKANGAPQVSLRAGERSRRAGGMRLQRRARRLRLDGIDVVLVDDVRTSGTSLRTAGRLLRRLGPRRIVAAVLAVTDDRGRSHGIGR
jgi:predicted amidophosphoribosyltransferase